MQQHQFATFVNSSFFCHAALFAQLPSMQSMDNMRSLAHMDIFGANNRHRLVVKIFR